MNVGLLHPGEMGATLGAALRSAGHEVLWASEGRSAETRARAGGFVDCITVDAVLASSEVVLSVVPPHAAVELASSLPPYAGIYVDANAVSPATARTIGGLVHRFVDGGIIGGPPSPRLYLSGDEAPTVAALFKGSAVRTPIVGNASALKCAYAGWTKGSGALLLAVVAFARAEGVEEELLAEWQPDLIERLAGAERSAARKGWRWIGEMEEIAAAFEEQGLPPGFHEAAAQTFRAEASGSRGRADSR